MKKERRHRLINKAIAGDELAQIELLSLKRNDVLGLALKILGNYHDAEDAVQEVAIVLRKNMGSLRSVHAFDSWVYRITYHVCLGMKKRQLFPKSETIDDDNSVPVPEERIDLLPFEKAIAREDKEFVVHCLEELNDLQKTCLMRFYFDEKSYEEIADELGVSVKAVSNALDRGKKKLRLLVMEKGQNAYSNNVPDENDRMVYQRGFSFDAGSGKNGYRRALAG